MTPEAREAIERADVLFHLASDPDASAWLDRLHPDSRPLGRLYGEHPTRLEAYEAMVEAVLGPVRVGARVCVAFYGHPGVFVRPSHEAIRRARAEGHQARMLPAISAEDCLFADLGLDPADAGCASHEATQFLLHALVPDPRTALVLWQISVIGVPSAITESRLDRLPVLVDYLARWYPRTHEVVVYEASPYPFVGPAVSRVPLGELASAELTPLSTLYVPPARGLEPDETMAELLGLPARAAPTTFPTAS